jgi:hypothetical protein
MKPSATLRAPMYRKYPTKVSDQYWNKQVYASHRSSRKHYIIAEMICVTKANKQNLGVIHGVVERKLLKFTLWEMGYEDNDCIQLDQDGVSLLFSREHGDLQVP